MYQNETISSIRRYILTVMDPEALASMLVVEEPSGSDTTLVRLTDELDCTDDEAALEDSFYLSSRQRASRIQRRCRGHSTRHRKTSRFATVSCGQCIGAKRKIQARTMAYPMPPAARADDDEGQEDPDPAVRFSLYRLRVLSRKLRITGCACPTTGHPVGGCFAHRGGSLCCAIRVGLGLRVVLPS